MAIRASLLLISSCAMIAAKTNVLTANYGNDRSNANLQTTNDNSARQASTSVINAFSEDRLSRNRAGRQASTMTIGQSQASDGAAA